MTRRSAYGRSQLPEAWLGLLELVGWAYVIPDGHTATAATGLLLGHLGDDRLGGEDVLGDRGGACRAERVTIAGSMILSVIKLVGSRGCRACR